jgi:hypothetical protein
MNYAEAAKIVKAEKPKDNFMILEFAYNAKFIVPHKEGVAIIAAMVNAEKLQDGYGDPKRIVEIERDYLSTRWMSYAEYQRYKIAGLLNITPDEVKEMMEAEAQPKPVTL